MLLADSFLKLDDSDSVDECRSCNVEDCHPVEECVAGVVKDSCGCCDECGKSENELCDHPDLLNYRPGYYGSCGIDLECKIRSDVNIGEAMEAVCFCMDEEEVCGSDDNTYGNVCQLKASAAMSNSEVSVRKEGPCLQSPVIVNHPVNVKNYTGSRIALLCEARGYPIPMIEWTWTRVDGKILNLPSDDLRISINMRGGPEKWQVTGWLQIIDLQKKHEGDYTCIAMNAAESFAKSSARVKVVEKREAL